MTQGRRKTPTALRVVRSGSANPSEPQADLMRDVPPCPEYLTGAAAEEWDRAARDLIDVGVLTSLDLPLLATWCQQFKIWRSCVETLNRLAEQDPSTRGVIVRAPSGAAYQNPVLGAMNSAAREMRKLAQELGLSPSGRAGVIAAPGVRSSTRAAALADKYGI